MAFTLELQTFDYFQCTPECDFGYLGPISPNCPNAPDTLKRLKLVHQMTLTLSKTRMELKTSYYFLCITAHDSGYLGPVSPKMSQLP